MVSGRRRAPAVRAGLCVGRVEAVSVASLGECTCLLLPPSLSLLRVLWAQRCAVGSEDRLCAVAALRAPRSQLSHRETVRPSCPPKARLVGARVGPIAQCRVARGGNDQRTVSCELPQTDSSVRGLAVCHQLVCAPRARLRASVRMSWLPVISYRRLSQQSARRGSVRQDASNSGRRPRLQPVPRC